MHSAMLHRLRRVRARSVRFHAMQCSTIHTVQQRTVHTVQCNAQHNALGHNTAHAVHVVCRHAKYGRRLMPAIRGPPTGTSDVARVMTLARWREPDLTDLISGHSATRRTLALPCSGSVCPLNLACTTHMCGAAQHTQCSAVRSTEQCSAAQRAQRSAPRHHAHSAVLHSTYSVVQHRSPVQCGTADTVPYRTACTVRWRKANTV